MITEDNFEMCFRLQITQLATKRVKKSNFKMCFWFKISQFIRPACEFLEVSVMSFTQNGHCIALQLQKISNEHDNSD